MNILCCKSRLAQLKPKYQRLLPQSSVWFSNQFLSQEPGSNKDIKEFARSKGFKGVLMDKIDVNGPKASPVYTFLKACFLAMTLPSSFPAFCLPSCFTLSWSQTVAGHYTCCDKVTLTLLSFWPRACAYLTCLDAASCIATGV